MEKVFLNNGLVDIETAGISVADSGLLYGAGLFETMRSYNGVAFALDEHLNRLIESAAALSIENSYKKKYLSEAVYKVLEANKLTDARLRLTLTGGPIKPEQSQRKSTLLITAAKLQPYPAEYYKNGILVVLCPYKQNPQDPTCGHKSLNYFARIHALDLARRKRAAESLWFTTDNKLAEGCISNVFLVKDSILYTPLLQTPVLAGIIRNAIFKIAEKHSIDVIEKDLYINDCLDADEVFLTNSIMQIMPVNKIEQHVVGDGCPGRLTGKLIKYFDEFVAESCRRKK